MIKGLETDSPDPKLKEKLKIFSQFIGNWIIDSIWYLPENVVVKGKGEVSFGWILFGTAIQDVWKGDAINPPPNFPQNGFGTTIRFYDVSIDACKCIWIAPKINVIQIFIAKKIGSEIVLEGKNNKNEPEKWIYSKITSQSFNWSAERSIDGGVSWLLEQKIFAKRTK